MGIKSISIITTALIFSTSANAALVERLGGLAYYDNVADLTWLADANAAGTALNWDDANAWAASLDVAGITGWRLADTLQPDVSCDGQSQSGGISYGYNCSGSEMGNLFYNVLGGIAQNSIITTHNANYDLFSNIQLGSYWTSLENANYTPGAWFFDMTGGQDALTKSVEISAWAVQSGDVGVSAVPVPAAVWLFGSGLMGLIGVVRRKKS